MYRLTFFVISCFIFATSQVLLAEDTESASFNCAVSIMYKWQPKEGKKKSLEVEVSKLDVKAASEGKGKAYLEKKLSRAKTAAMEQCRKDHENVAGCVASKFKMMASVLRRMPFSARSSLETAINEDCKAAQGSCQSAEAGEIKCMATASGEAEGEGGEEAKK